jgi:hypothetical protein
MRYKRYEIEPAVRDPADGSAAFTPRVVLISPSAPNRRKRLRWPHIKCATREEAERRAIAEVKRVIDLGDFD